LEHRLIDDLAPRHAQRLLLGSNLSSPSHRGEERITAALARLAGAETTQQTNECDLEAFDGGSLPEYFEHE
jgi:hypothetical protein